MKITSLLQNTVISQNSSMAARILWYQKHCTKTKRFCHQLSLAKTSAADLYRGKMRELENKKLIEKEIVKSIETRNPQIGRHLANNMKDYIMSRMNKEFY